MLNRLKTIVRAQLTQGVTADELALTCSLACVIGTFPFFGTTTALCFIVGVMFRLNQPLLQALNYSLTPIHLILVPVFLKLGEFILNRPPVSIHPEEILLLIKTDWKQFASDYGLALCYAILAWALTAPWVGIAIFYIVRPIVIKINRRRSL